MADEKDIETIESVAGEATEVAEGTAPAEAGTEAPVEETPKEAAE